MVELTPAQAETLRPWFLPEPPAPLMGLHVLNSGRGVCYADRWPRPRTILANAAGNYALRGDPFVVAPAALRPLITGFVAAAPAFVPLLRATFERVVLWPRVVLELEGAPNRPAAPGFALRRLGAADGPHLARLSPEVAWIAKSWGGAGGLAESGLAWGAFADGRLAAVACTFFLGDRYEELGVVTEPEYRGLGLSAACTAALCEDVIGRGRRPAWSTSSDNQASLRVAEKVGFRRVGAGEIYVIGLEPPAPVA